MRLPSLLVPTFGFLIAFVPAASAEEVSNPQLDMRLTIPVGFQPDPTRVKDEVLYSYHRGPVGNDRIGTFFFIKKLPGPVSRDKLTVEELRQHNPSARLSGIEKWKVYDIDVVLVPEVVGNTQVITLNAVIPLKPNAIQVSVFGEANREEELRTVLRLVVGSVEGQTNWLNKEERALRSVRFIIFLVVSVLAVGGALLTLWRIYVNYQHNRSLSRRKSRKRSVDYDD